MQATAESFAQAREGDEFAKEYLFRKYHRLATNIAWKYAKAYADDILSKDDAIAVAYVGLTKAIMRFEPERGYKFSTYAVPMITGEIRRYLREQKPKGYRRGHTPPQPIVNISLHQPMYRNSGGEGIVLADTISTPDTTEPIALLQVVEKVIATHTLKEQKIIRQSIGLDATQINIAGSVKISQAQVSRILKRFRERMKRELAHAGDIYDVEERREKGMAPNRGDLDTERTAFDRPLASVPANIDLALMEKVLPAKSGGGRKTPYIVVSANRVVRLTAAAVKLAPEMRRSEKTVECYLSKDRKTLVVIPKPDAEIGFRSQSKVSVARVFTASAVSKEMRKKGITLPAKLLAEWDNELQAWVGKLVDMAVA